MNVEELWDFEDPAGSEERFRTAVKSASGTDADVLRTQLARSLGLQERYDEAHRELDEVAGDRDAGEVGVRVALERGRLFRSAGHPDRARPCFAEAAARADAADLPGLRIDALHMLALLEETPQGQVGANRTALEAARSSSDPAARRWEASLLNNLGCALVDSERLDEALAVFEDALAVRQTRGERREVQIARWMVAWTLRLQGRRDEALAMQRALKAELTADGIEDEYVDQELALLTTPDPEPEHASEHDPA